MRKICQNIKKTEIHNIRLNFNYNYCGIAYIIKIFKYLISK